MLSVSSNVQQPDSGELTTANPSSASVSESLRFGIKSNNVILEDFFEPTEAIILIENQKIVDVIITKETDPETLTNIYKNWDITDHGSLYIFPGLVDCNVHLHTDFNSEWENVTYGTELAAAGGVTTIVDNPIMCKPFSTGEDYILSLKRRINILKSNSKVDFGVFAALEPKTQGYIDKILEAGAIGLKCYLLSCIQNTIGHFSSEMFPALMEELEKYPDLLLMVHPELATERDIYLTSPCRNVALEKRLDMNYPIKPYELGGAANRGSYLDELCKKSTAEDDDEDDDCPTARLETPTQLKGKVKKAKEKTEIQDIVHYELLSYNGYDHAQKSEPQQDDSSDSDGEISKELSTKKSKSLPVCAEVLENFGDTPESGSEEGERKNEINTAEVPINLETKAVSEEKKPERPIPLKLPKKRSLFCPNPFREIKKIKEVKEVVEDNEEKDSKDETPKLLELPPIEKSEKFVSVTEQEPANDNKIMILSRLKSYEPTLIKPTLQIPRQISLGCGVAKPPEANKTLTQTRKLLTFLAGCDKPSINTACERKINAIPKPIIALDPSDDKENKEIRSAPIIKAFHHAQNSSSSPKNECSPLNADAKSSTMSPMLSSKPMTPASSSLLLRRLSRKSSYGVTISGPSTISSPLSDFTKVNSLEVMKSPRSIAKKEAKFNQSYRIFLANRPQNWEENAVTLVLSTIKADTNMRVILPNLSLASSFLKIRQKKKSNDVFLKKIFSDTSPAYLFFNEKMVEKGDTKYKVSPPFRNKENRRLLVENLRLGGIDVMSSYHFFVPPRFKRVDDGNFRRAFGGLDSMGCSLQAAWTAVYSYQQKTNKKFVDDIIYQKKIINHILRQLYKSMSFNPSQMLKIGERKGSIAKGRDADLVLWDPFKVDNNNELGINHAFAGRALLGTVCKTYLRGKLIYNKDHSEQVSRDYQAELIRA